MADMRGWGRAAVLLIGGALAGCGGDQTAVGMSSNPIANGEPDPSLTAVVGLLDLISGTTADLCSGSLLAPNAVLTARHCVSDLVGATNGVADCTTTGVGPVRPVEHFFVTTDPTLPMGAAAFHRVSEILVPSATVKLLCGNDLAILILQDNVAAAVAQPLSPATDGSPRPDEVYSAVGFGATDGQQNNAGMRRRRDGLHVSCVGTACGTSQVAATEFAGDEGICAGDSGGPALDASQRIIGVASRGGQKSCSLSVYEDAFASLDFLRSAVTHAAEVGGFTAPEWTRSSTPVTPEPTPSSGGCAVRTRSRAAGALGTLLLVAPLALVLRRARRPRAS